MALAIFFFDAFQKHFPVITQNCGNRMIGDAIWKLNKNDKNHVVIITHLVVKFLERLCYSIGLLLLIQYRYKLKLTQNKFNLKH